MWATINLKRRTGFFIAVLLLFSFVIPSLHASADTIVRGFSAKGSIQPGMLVALDKSASDTVEVAPANDPSKIFGVVIDPSQAPVTVQKQGQQVFVATGGSYAVLVNTENGAIKPGDYISVSSVNGIGTKASNNQPLVLGKAIEPFDGKSGIITTDSSGAAIGRIIVNIIPGKNPLVKDSVAIPAPLKRFGEAIAGKNISAIRIYAAMAFFLVTAAVAFGVLWAGIRNGMIAIGRNPLSRKTITKSLIQVIVMAFLVFIVGMIGVYLLLKL